MYIWSSDEGHGSLMLVTSDASNMLPGILTSSDETCASSLTDAAIATDKGGKDEMSWRRNKV